MKKILLSAVVMVLGTITMTAQNTVAISDFKITAKETKTIAVELNNATSFTAFQMDVVLPDGVNYVQENGEKCISLAGERAGSSFVLTESEVAGATRIVVYSNDNTPFSGTSGALLNIKVVADADLQDGAGEVKLSNVYFSDTDGKETQLTDATTAVTFASHFSATVNYGAGGFAALNNVAAPAFGEARMLYIMPNDGYKLAELLFNGTAVDVKNNIYEISSVEQDVVFEASFAEVIPDTVEVIKTVTDTIEIETIITDTVVVAEVTEIPVPEIDFSNGQMTIKCALQTAAIYYTLDGTVPTMASTKYTAPVEISEDCKVTAIAVLSSESASFNIVGTGIGGTTDDVVSRQYFTEAGVEIDELREGINIVIVKYASGKVETQKVIVRKK